MGSRGQERDDMGLPYSMPYRSPSAPVADRRITAPASQTLDRQQTLPPPQQQHGSRDSDPDPDPLPAANAAAPGASNSRTTPPPAAAVVNNHATSPSVRYRECQKNHAASTGGHVVDGCGEFMPGGEDGTPEALRCAACDCHRNFHRRESAEDPQPAGTSSYHHHSGGGRHTNNSSHHHHHHSSMFRGQVQTPLITVSHHLQPPPPPPQLHTLSHSYPSPTAPMMMTFGGGAAESSSEDLNVFGYTNSGGQGIHGHYSGSRKRFRTKFTHNQKEKMQEFAERLGWKIQKQDDREVHQFCSEVGIKRQVFKVWMHNNKQAMKKKE